MRWFTLDRADFWPGGRRAVREITLARDAAKRESTVTIMSLMDVRRGNRIPKGKPRLQMRPLLALELPTRLTGHLERPAPCR
jgi:hypothetical protein